MSTFYAFSRSFYSNKVTRMCMCIQGTENLLYLLQAYFEYTCSKKTIHKWASRKWKTHTTFFFQYRYINSKQPTRKCAARNGKPAFLYTYFRQVYYTVTKSLLNVHPQDRKLTLLSMTVLSAKTATTTKFHHDESDKQNDPHYFPYFEYTTTLRQPSSR